MKENLTLSLQSLASKYQVILELRQSGEDFQIILNDKTFFEGNWEDPEIDFKITLFLANLESRLENDKNQSPIYQGVTYQIEKPETPEFPELKITYK